MFELLSLRRGDNKLGGNVLQVFLQRHTQRWV